MHPVDLLAPVSPISWDNIALRGVQAPTRAGRDGKRLNSTVYHYSFLLATPRSLKSLGKLLKPLQTTIDSYARIRINQPINDLCNLIKAPAALRATNQPKQI